MIDTLQHLQKGTGLLVVDVQRDFCPGGRLPVPGGDKVVPVLNEWIEAALSREIPVYASRDWHPKGHVSFEEAGRTLAAALRSGYRRRPIPSRPAHGQPYCGDHQGRALRS